MRFTSNWAFPKILQRHHNHLSIFDLYALYEADTDLTSSQDTILSQDLSKQNFETALDYEVLIAKKKAKSLRICASRLGASRRANQTSSKPRAPPELRRKLCRETNHGVSNRYDPA